MNVLRLISLRDDDSSSMDELFLVFSKVLLKGSSDRGFTTRNIFLLLLRLFIWRDVKDETGTNCFVVCEGVENFAGIVSRRSFLNVRYLFRKVVYYVSIRQIRTIVAVGTKTFPVAAGTEARKLYGYLFLIIFRIANQEVNVVIDKVIKC